MLDINSKKVLEYLVSECEEGKFKNIEFEDIQTFLPQEKLSDVQIKKILLHLEEMSLVTIKFKSDDVFCLTVLPYAKMLFEKEYTEKTNQIKFRKFAIKMVVLVCIFAFLGSFLGIIVYNLIFWKDFYFVR